MNIVTPQFIREYLVSNFGEKGRFVSGEQEFVMPSLFVEDDWKKHLSVNVYTGLWQCFKTGRKGDFTRLYAASEGINYYQAQRDIIFKNFHHLDLTEKQLERYAPIHEKKNLEISPEMTIPLCLNSHESNNELVKLGWCFAYSRKLFDFGLDPGDVQFYVCHKGRFADRIIIPFYQEGITIYFQARTLKDSNQKYLNPSEDMGPPQSHILYPFDETASYVVVCEGPLDARSLQLQGVNATATMKSYVSPFQAEILSTFEGDIILGYDNDVAGLRGESSFELLRRRMRMPEFDVVHPPSGCKDWNEAHVKKHDLASWIGETRTCFNFEYICDVLMNLGDNEEVRTSYDRLV